MSTPPARGRTRELARRAITVLATPASDEASRSSARAQLERCLEADLVPRITELPPRVTDDLVRRARAGEAFDAVGYSLRRHILARWRTWRDDDRAMPAFIRTLSRADATHLRRLREAAGAVHVALIAAGLDAPRRVNLLTCLDERRAARVLSLVQDLPEPPPRREVHKARLHVLLSVAESDRADRMLDELGRQAFVWMFRALSSAHREHLRRAWPVRAYNELAGRPDAPEPDWHLADSTWQRLIDGTGDRN